MYVGYDRDIFVFYNKGNLYKLLNRTCYMCTAYLPIKNCTGNSVYT